MALTSGSGRHLPPNAGAPRWSPDLCASIFPRSPTSPASCSLPDPESYVRRILRSDTSKGSPAPRRPSGCPILRCHILCYPPACGTTREWGDGASARVCISLARHVQYTWARSSAHCP